MAKTIIAPIIKSSNSLPYSNEYPINAYFASGGLRYVYAPYTTTSNILQCIASAGSQGLVTSGLKWDDSVVPEGKVITNITLHFYTTKGEGKPVFYRYAEFNEGSKIPSYEPSDGSKAGGYSTGWGSLDLGTPKGNSIIIGQELGSKRVPIYDNGVLLDYIQVAECWQFYSHRSPNNKPYVVITYEDIPPEPPKSLYPSNMLLSTRNIIRLAWLHDSKEGLDQSGFTLQYSVNNGGAWSTISKFTTEQFYDMPANTLPEAGTVLWRVKTEDTEGAESAYSTASFTLGIPPQKAPIAVAPISQYIEESKETRFEWVFTGGGPGDIQSKYDLQYSLDSGTNWTTLTEATERNYKVVEGNTFNTGTIMWRVRTYNDWEEISPYSEIKAFTVIGSPSAPLITNISNSAKPIINWQSESQQTYELQIEKENKIIFESGTIPRADKSYKIPIFLENGSYIAKLRISNEYNFLSDWAEKNFIINVKKPDKAEIQVFNREFSVLIESDKPGLVYRDNKLIGEITNAFEDFTGQNKKEYKYFVRTVTSDAFNDSLIKIGYCNFKGATLSQKDGDFVRLLYGLNMSPAENMTFGVTANVMHFDGRKYPSVEYSEFNNRSVNLTYFIRTKKERDKIEEMINNRKTFLLRLKKENIYGSILGLTSVRHQFGYEISFIIEKTGDDYE